MLGLGVYLYMRALKMLAILFLVLGIVAGPAIYLYYTSGRSASSVFRFEVTTLGNLGLASNQTAHTGNKAINLSPKEVGLVVSSLDAGIVALFLVFWLYFWSSSSSDAEEYMQDVLTSAHYTCEVTNFPTDVKRREMQEFFQSRYGKVVDVAMAYDNQRLLELYTERGRQKQLMQAAKMSKDQSALQSAGTKVATLDAEITLLVGAEKPDPLMAWVTFDTVESAQACLKDFNAWTYLYCGCCVSKNLYFKGVKMTVKPAPEPSNVQYHNLGVGSANRALRWAIGGFLSLLFLVGSVGIVYYAQTYQQKLPKDSACAIGITREMAVRNATFIPCYCKSLGAKVLDAGDLCNSWLMDWITAKALLAASSIVIVIVNKLLILLLGFFVKFERLHSKTVEETSAASRMFYALFINTAIVMPAVFYGSYPELDPEWFAAVGMSLLFTMMINVFAPNAGKFVSGCFGNCLRSCKAGSARSQYELNQIYSGEPYELAERYSMLLNVVFTCFIYAGPMPLMLLIAAAYFFATYWTEKYVMVNYHALPPRYDGTMHSLALSYFPAACLLHILVSIYAFSGPSVDSFGVSDISKVSWLPGLLGNIWRRATLVNTLPLTVLGLIIIAAFSLKTSLGLLFRRLCCCCCNNKQTQVEPFSFPSFTQAVEMKQFKLESYRVDRQPQYLTAYITTESGKQLAPTSKLDGEPPQTTSQVTMLNPTSSTAAAGGAGGGGQMMMMAAQPLFVHTGAGGAMQLQPATMGMHMLAQPMVQGGQHQHVMVTQPMSMALPGTVNS